MPRLSASTGLNDRSTKWRPCSSPSVVGRSFAGRAWISRAARTKPPERLARQRPDDLEGANHCRGLAGRLLDQVSDMLQAPVLLSPPRSRSTRFWLCSATRATGCRVCKWASTAAARFRARAWCLPRKRAIGVRHADGDRQPPAYRGRPVRAPGRPADRQPAWSNKLIEHLLIGLWCRRRAVALRRRTNKAASPAATASICSWPAETSTSALVLTAISAPRPPSRLAEDREVPIIVTDDTLTTVERAEAFRPGAQAGCQDRPLHQPARRQLRFRPPVRPAWPERRVAGSPPRSAKALLNTCRLSAIINRFAQHLEK